MKSVAIIVNKNWEAEPVLAGMVSNEIRASNLPFPEQLLPLQPKKFTGKDPRATFCYRNADKEIFLQVKVWCIEDMMNKDISTSSSKEKYDLLQSLFKEEKADLVIAAGTAGYISETSYSGSVVVGGRFFVHNGHPGSDDKYLNLPDFEKLLDMNINSMVFGIINTAFKQKTEVKFLKVPNNPANRAAVLSSQYYTAIGSVNIFDYAEYAWVDAEAITAFRKVEQKFPVGSLETTHGVIRLSSNYPCMFVSAITDREGHFDMEVTPGQNYVASFNAGIVLGQFVADLKNKLNDPTFSIKP